MRKYAKKFKPAPVNREDFVRQTVTCRFCQAEQDVMRYTGQPTLPLHRRANGTPCDGSGATLEHAAVGHQRQLNLDPELGNSKLPNFYEKDEFEEFGF